MANVYRSAQAEDGKVNIDSEFAQRVKQYRAQHAYTQKKMGELCKVSGSTISAIELGRRVLWASKYRVEKVIGA